MAEKRNTVPMSLDEAKAYLRNGKRRVEFGEHTPDIFVMTYAETLRLHERLDSIENQAQEMMSPDAMMEMAQKFLGGGF